MKLYAIHLMVLTLAMSTQCPTLSAQTNRAVGNGKLVQSRFEAMDKNNDGEITASETERPFVIRRFDSDASGGLSITEFRALMERIVGGRPQPAGDDSPWKASPFENDLPNDAPITKTSILAAAKYSAEHDGISFLILYDGELIYDDYPNGGSESRYHELASGTKSFTGVLAMAAIEDGIIESLEENVSDTITEWKNDARKSKITVRSLLNLTSGINPGSETSQQVPSYASAIQNRASEVPGKKFAYGPAHFQCFGEFLQRKLVASGSEESVLEYLERRIFKPIGLEHGPWRTDTDGNAHLPSGVRLTASQWAKFGELVRLGGRWNETQIVSQDSIKECLTGSPANPAYGLTFWLNEPVADAQRRSIRQLRFATDDLTSYKNIPSDIVFAAGAGKQRLFISPDAKLVVVRQASGIVDSLEGKQSQYSDAVFLKNLFERQSVE